MVLNMRKDEEIVPYMLKAPDYFGQYFHLFQQLGAADEIYVEGYCRVLESIKNESKDKAILPCDELKTVEKSLIGVLFCLQSDGHCINRLNSGKCTLYILNEKKSLKPSSSLVVADKVKLKFRLMSQNKIDFIFNLSAIRGLHKNIDPEELLMTLPLRMRPTLLSDIVTEKLANDPSNFASSTFADELEVFLTSKRYKYVVERLVKTYQKQNFVNVTKAEFDEMNKKLHTLKVRSIIELKTVLMYDKSPLDGSIWEQQIFYDKQTHTLYLKAEVPFQKQSNIIAVLLVDMCKIKMQKGLLLGV